MPITLEFNRKHSVEIVETGDNDLCASLCKLLECYLNPIALQKSEKPLTNEQVDHLENILENLFFFSLIWSIGVTGNDASRIKFDAFFKENINKNSKIPFPSQNTVYDYMFDEEQK
jgi:dynein heavy chain